jgi:hypothetical protein
MAKVNVDMWYEDREPDFSKDVLGTVFHNDIAGLYWANILDRKGKFIGDITCMNSVELGRWASLHGAKIQWKE